MKGLSFIGSSREDIRAFPEEVKDDIGYALREVQKGEKPACAKPLKGFGGSGVLEIIDNFCGDTYRAVCTVRFEKMVYVLHCFKKKSKHGIKTSVQDMSVILDTMHVRKKRYSV